jgi:hypothetical protein
MFEKSGEVKLLKGNNLILEERKKMNTLWRKVKNRNSHYKSMIK